MGTMAEVRGRPFPLRPFLLKLNEGYLLGLAMDPAKGSPCSRCAELWLKQRKVNAEPAPLSDLRVRRELIAELLSENTPHAFYEIHSRPDSKDWSFPIPAAAVPGKITSPRPSLVKRPTLPFRLSFKSNTSATRRPRATCG